MLPKMVAFIIASKYYNMYIIQRYGLRDFGHGVERLCLLPFPTWPWASSLYIVPELWSGVYGPHLTSTSELRPLIPPCGDNSNATLAMLSGLLSMCPSQSDFCVRFIKVTGLTWAPIERSLFVKI